MQGILEASSATSGIVTLDGCRIQLPHRGLSSGPVDVVIRPEAIRLVDTETPGCLRAAVRTAACMGAQAEYNLDTLVGPLFVIAPEANALRAVDSSVGVTLASCGVFAVKP